MDRKIDGSVVLVFYLVVIFLMSFGTMIGWIGHVWYAEDKMVLCEAYNKKQRI